MKENSYTSKAFTLGLKGVGMGAANVIPGVSGGTIALITGIYSEIIEAINAFTLPSTWKSLFTGKIKDFWTAIHGTFLLWLFIGIGVSVLSLAKLMTFVLANFPVETWAFFFGLILASAVLMFRDIHEWSFIDALIAITGCILGVVVCTLTPTQTPNDLWFIFICGAISICTMILPGISGSFILLVLGKYDYIMSALDVTAFKWDIIIVFALGCLLGILAFAKFLHWLLGKWEKQTMILLLGFILGSLVKIWPWSNKVAIAASQYPKFFESDGIDKEFLAQELIDLGKIDFQVLWAVVFAVAGVCIVIAIDEAEKTKHRRDRRRQRAQQKAQERESQENTNN